MSSIVEGRVIHIRSSAEYIASCTCGWVDDIRVNTADKAWRRAAFHCYREHDDRR